MKYYDYVVSLGASCYTAILLKKLKLQGPSNVFDWSGGNIIEKCGIGGFIGKIQLVKDHFKNAFNLQDLELFNHPDTSEIKRPIRNKRTGLQYIHDFPKEKSIEEEFPHYKQKYIRRIERLYDCIKNSNRVLFLFILQGSTLPIKDMKKAEALMNEMFSNKIDFLIIQNVEDAEECQELCINNHLKLVLWQTIFSGRNGKFNPKFEDYLEREVITKYKIEYLQTKIQSLTERIHKLDKFLSNEQLIESSEYFDADWYIKNYSLKEQKPALHYLKIGYQLKMNPSLKFDGNKYIAKNLDVSKAGMNPLLHYLRHGEREGRRIYEVQSKIETSKS